MSSNKEDENEGENQVYVRNQFEYDRMQSIHEDVVAIERFHEIKDTTIDTFLYTVFAFEVFLTAFLAGMITKYYYIVHTIKVLILLPSRWYVFKQIGKHYFMLELCTYVHMLIMFYIWSPWKPSWMFPALFLLAHGPLIFAVYYWRNAFVPHSAEKMCTLFIHVAPAMVTWSIRWYSTPDQGFQLCAHPTEPGIHGCYNVGWGETIVYPFIIYVGWLAFYVPIIFIWREERIKERNYMTAFSIMSGEKKMGIMHKLIHLLGPNYIKQMYIVTNTLFGTIFTIIAYFCYISLAYNYIYFCLFVFLSCYNGATFYIKVVGKKYYAEKEEKKD